MKFAAAVQSVIQCYHVIYGERKSYYPDVTGSVLQEGQEDWIQQWTRTCAINVRREWNCSLPPSPMAMTLQLHRLPAPLPPPVSNPSRLFTWFQALCARCSTVLLCFSRYCTGRLKMVFCLREFVFMYYLCEKDNKPVIVQYYIANYVSWVRRLTLLELQTIWT